MGGSGTFEPPRPPRTNECDRLRFETVLMSPQKEALASIEPQDSLIVQLQGTAPQRFAAVLRPNGQLVGTVGSEKAIRLIGCLEQGYMFVAAVLEIDGGACRVQIQPVAR
jgi:hypothetical protein